MVLSADPSVPVSLLRGFIDITRRQLGMGEMKIAGNPKNENDLRIKTTSETKMTLKMRRTKNEVVLKN